MTIDHTRHFCIFDYYLDGVFLKWEEVKGECPIIATGQQWTVNLNDGRQVTGEITETVMVSENEQKVLLKSLTH